AGSADGVVDPVVELNGQRGIFAVDEVQEELPVSLGTGQARVYDPGYLGRPGEGGLGDVAQDAAMNFRVAHDAPFADVVPTRLELRLDEDERLPAGTGEREHRRERHAHTDERDVAHDELRRERQLRDLA